MDNNLAPRLIFPLLKQHLVEKEITVIVGPRQAGKTTLVKQLMAGLADAYYFNLDLVSDRALFQSQTDVIQFIKNRLGGKKRIYLFVDEAQRLTNPGLFFKGIYDLEMPVKIILTGSSSLEIRAKINEPLTGRKRLFRLYPFSFGEYLLIKEPALLSFLEKNDPYSERQILSHLEQFMLFGGYPKVVLTKNLEEKIACLQEIYESYIDKDVVGFLRIKDSFAFGKLVRILAEETGGLFNLEKISQEIGIKNTTLRNYLRALENTFVVQRLLPYFSSTRTEIRKMPKVYFWDTGLRNFAKDWRDFSWQPFSERPDKGPVLENFIFSELLKAEAGEVNFWRTKDGAEIDFIVSKKGKKIPVEIKAQSLEEIEISRGYLSYLERYQPPLGIIISFSHLSPRTINKTEIHFLSPYELIPFLAKV